MAIFIQQAALVKHLGKDGRADTAIGHRVALVIAAASLRIALIRARMSTDAPRTQQTADPMS